MERSRLKFMLAWLHATILERLRFCHIGWFKAFEFSDKATKDRSNIDPNEIPWDELHKMQVQYVYGGRVDNKYDTARIEGFGEALFCPEAFNDKFAQAPLCEMVGADEEKAAVAATTWWGGSAS